MSADLEQGALLPRLRAGDADAFRQLIRDYQGRFLRLALGFVSSRAAAEEVVQDTWIGVVKGLPGFEERASLQTWMYRILVNRARSRGAKEGRDRAFTEGQGLSSESVLGGRFAADGRWASPPNPWESPAAERTLIHKEALARLSTALDELSEQQRAVVVLRDVEGLDASEVCSVLELSEANQRVLLHRGRTKLRAALEEVMEPR